MVGTLHPTPGMERGRNAGSLMAACLFVMAMAACAGMESSATAPTAVPSAAASLTLTVRVHERNEAAAPIADALVVHGSTVAYTDAAGESRFFVLSGRESTVDVSANGYRPMQASAVVNADERWTFFLEPELKP